MKNLLSYGCYGASNGRTQGSSKRRPKSERSERHSPRWLLLERDADDTESSWRGNSEAETTDCSQDAETNPVLYNNQPAPNSKVVGPHLDRSSDY